MPICVFLSSSSGIKKKLWYMICAMWWNAIYADGSLQPYGLVVIVAELIAVSLAFPVQWVDDVTELASWMDVEAVNQFLLWLMRELKVRFKCN